MITLPDEASILSKKFLMFYFILDILNQFFKICNYLYKVKIPKIRSLLTDDIFSNRTLQIYCNFSVFI